MVKQSRGRLLYVGGLTIVCGVVCATDFPEGARQLGYRNCVFDERPALSDITVRNERPLQWFSGQWYQKIPPGLDLYQQANKALAIELGGSLVSTPRDFSVGGLPLLSGNRGFYVEFEVRLSDNDSDHWPSVWLMPVEHNGRHDDHYVGDPEGFERWMELDVDEGGFGPGLTGSVHSWTGIWRGPSSYRRVSNQNNIDHQFIDRSQLHTFGASYDPVNLRVAWWVDGEKIMEASSPSVPEIARRQHFYLIVSAASHGANKPYLMFVSEIRAFEPSGDGGEVKCPIHRT